MYTNYAKTVSTLSQTAKITCVVFNMDHGNCRKKVSICKGKTHKKKCGTTKVLPSLHQWLSGLCHFFLFSPIIALNGF